MIIFFIGHWNGVGDCKFFYYGWRAPWSHVGGNGPNLSDEEALQSMMTIYNPSPVSGCLVRDIHVYELFPLYIYILILWRIYLYILWQNLMCYISHLQCGTYIWVIWKYIIFYIQDNYIFALFFLVPLFFSCYSYSLCYIIFHYIKPHFIHLFVIRIWYGGSILVNPGPREGWSKNETTIVSF